MTWEDLASQLGATRDANNWLRATRLSPTPRMYVIQQVTIRDWQLALFQTTIAREAQLGVAEGVMRLLPFPLGGLVLNEGCWVLRQALPLEGLTSERLELALRCLDFQAREMVAHQPHPSAASGLVNYYVD